MIGETPAGEDEDAVVEVQSIQTVGDIDNAASGLA